MSRLPKSAAAADMGYALKLGALELAEFPEHAGCSMRTFSSNSHVARNPPKDPECDRNFREFQGILIEEAATNTGLRRFDGMQFQQFPLLAGKLPTGMIHAMLADRRGRLWVAMEHQRVVCLDPGLPARVFDLKAGLSKQGTVSLVEDAQGTVWISYINLDGIGDGVVFRIQYGQVRLFGADAGLPKAGDSQLAVDQDGLLPPRFIRRWRLVPPMSSGIARRVAQAFPNHARPISGLDLCAGACNLRPR